MANYCRRGRTDKFYLEKTWTIVSFAQPVNALVFVLDGNM